MKIETITLALIIANAIRREASYQSCNGTELSLMLGEALERISETIEDKLHSIDLENREESLK
jgi:hypothetical protein